ncbi:YcgN family cysteine cluster protein [Aggregatibacter actinomycetemcomitans]|uniref:YcgN family cysteine cluster protein n=1 Tax=Aggregatibacter actinomycetemcomitans TaxID=714 RepID=UPI00197B97CE|nr:YcgN family cysteine cluster protein [Aggregatibacter actinomycetemcomitans]MBN6063107.1 YcgN family cysteine cluster protein [Aggregatibacter actinomycetemcomitans]MBN6076321.1 YcgN family cysteine cluster protein [Aggregatibacter actinomycetemcomitans]MBN6083002.1 YcgN family cysteine cluster protein [Aggregatibacter actinomycetemcomitans]
MQLEPDFWLHKTLLDMNDAEWEALCDGCGKCCYRKYIDGDGKYERLYYTRIACNLLDLETGKCGQYARRFELEEDCTKLTKENLSDFDWLPATCSYRLLHEGKPLPAWHPLISGDPNSVKKADILIKYGIHERDVIDWFDFILDLDEDH